MGTESTARELKNIMQNLSNRIKSTITFPVARMLKERSQFEGSFTQHTDDNTFNPKQIAPTLGMKEPPPTEVLMKGPSRFEKPTK